MPKRNNIASKISRESKLAEKRFARNLLAYAGAGSGFVVGLAWNDAISSFIKYLFPADQDSIVAKFIYAIVLTLAATVALLYAERLFAREKK